MSPVERLRRTHRVAERAVEGRRIFRGIGHDQRVLDGRAASSAARMAPTRPSIMSDGAMMSQPASACTSACRTSTSTRLVIGDIAVDQQAVMAVAGIGIERHVAQHADLGHRLLDGAHRAADQIVGVERFAPVVASSAQDRCRETARSPECRASPLPRRRRPRGRPTAARRPASTATGSRLLVAVDDEERPDQIGRRQRDLRHQPARPVVTPQPAHAQWRDRMNAGPVLAGSRHGRQCAR